MNLNLFYENVMKDYKSIIQIFASKKTQKQIEEIKDNCKFCFSFLNSYVTDDKNTAFIVNLIKNYIDEISNYLKNEEKIKTEIKVEEQDIYRAYGLLWGLEYVFLNSEEKDISEFNYKRYKNFTNFLEKYGSYTLLTKNYKKNYREEIQTKILNINFIKNWLRKLNEKGLKSLKENNIMSKKAKKKNHDETKEIKGQKNKENNANETPSEIQLAQKQAPYNIEEKIDKKIYTNINNNIIQEIKNNTNLIKENMASQDINNKEKINVPTPQSKIIKEINDEEGKLNNISKDKDINSEDNIKKGELPSINNNIKYNNKIGNINEELIDKLSIKNNTNSQTEENNSLSNKNNCNSQKETNFNLSDKNSPLQTETKIGSANKINSNYLENTNNDLSNNNKSISQFQANNDLLNVELTSIVLTLKKELTETKEKTEKLQKELAEAKKTLNQKIDKLEDNQLLMYHQMQIYISSRDIGKSINFFFYDYLFHDSKTVVTNEFEKLQYIMKYLNNDDYSLLNQTQKTKLRKYFRFHFFANRVLNKILHRNFKDDSKKILEEKRKNSDLIGLIPGFDYEECFDSLAYFIENNVKNSQLNTAMRMVYQNDYINDQGLKEIKDNEGEVIHETENGIEILMNKNDIEDIRNYFKTVSLKETTTSFVESCNNKNWDKGSKVLI